MNFKTIDRLIPQSEDLDRTIRFGVIRFFLRPARKVDNDLVGPGEKRVDQALSSFFRECLKAGGLASCIAPTSYGVMHYYDSKPGSAEVPIVLIHGIGSSGQCFALMGAMLASKRRVILPDLFHFSGFSKANNPVMRFHDHVASIKQLLEHLDVKTLDLGGISLGGWISMQIAAEHGASVAAGAPDSPVPEVRSLTLMNPAGPQANPYFTRDILLFLSWKKFRSLYPGITKAFPFTGIPLLSRTLKRSVYRTLRDDAVRDFIKSVGEDDFIDKRLHAIRCPTLLLWGREDRFLSSVIPYTLASKIAKVTPVWIERCAHVICLEAPLNCYLAMKNFLNLDDRKEPPLVQWLQKTLPLHPSRPFSAEERGLKGEP